MFGPTVWRSFRPVRRSPLCKPLRNNTRVSILCDLKKEKHPEFFIVCCSELENLQNHAFTVDSDDGIANLREYRSATMVKIRNNVKLEERVFQMPRNNSCQKKKIDSTAHRVATKCALRKPEISCYHQLGMTTR